MTQRKGTIVLFCGLGALGVQDYAEALAKQGLGFVIDKNLITDVLFKGGNHIKSEGNIYHEMKDRVYKLMLDMAVTNAKLGNTVLLHAYFGDKLSSADVQNLIRGSGEAYNVRIVYLHASAEKQQAKIAKRRDGRDDDKKGDNFLPYRIDHMHKHYRELAQINSFLAVDVEEDAEFPRNVNAIAAYIKALFPTVEYRQLEIHGSAQSGITEEAATGNFSVFIEALRKFGGSAFSVADVEDLALFASNTKQHVMPKPVTYLKSNIDGKSLLVLAGLSLAATAAALRLRNY